MEPSSAATHKECRRFVLGLRHPRIGSAAALAITALLLIVLPKQYHMINNVRDLRSSRYLEDATPITSAIAALVPNSDSDLLDFCLALTSLKNLPKNSAHLLVFHEGNLSEDQLDAVEQCADRPVYFHTVDFKNNFPAGFDPQLEFKKGLIERGTGNAGRHLGRDAWGYQQMIRFWTSAMWQHPAVQKYETVMRIDTDSCFVKIDADLDDDNDQTQKLNVSRLPSLGENIVYQSFLSASSPYFGVGLFDFTQAYIELNNIQPSYPELWDRIKTDWETTQTLPIMQTNLEISKRSFFHRDDVKKWHSALTEEEPFGVFRYRWGDAQTRVLTMALFGTKETVLTSPTAGYYHGRGVCSKLLGIDDGMIKASITSSTADQ